ncbi:MAG TPA: hypothetical protein VJT67_05275 [Longimicrobiaceae bacterium]|nr:hypothetical protein [Longimicrobiaceae bacterium]
MRSAAGLAYSQVKSTTRPEPSRTGARMAKPSGDCSCAPRKRSSLSRSASSASISAVRSTWVSTTWVMRPSRARTGKRCAWLQRARPPRSVETAEMS